MRVLLTGVLGAALLLIAQPGLAQQMSTTPPPASPAATGSPSGVPAVRQLVYRFGYNTQATDEGRSTGTTTIDFVGRAKDGGMTVTATDDWWNGAKPRQSFTCEVYPSGAVTCATAPFALSPIQVAIVPLLGRRYFAALSAGSHASWTQSYAVRATFFPGASGFAGQVYTWNSAFTLTGKGLLSKGSPLIAIDATGSMKQQGGRYYTANVTSSIAFDPRIRKPALIDDVITFVPTYNVNRYTVQLRLIKVVPQ
jgi:hypothetical protein